MNKEVFINKVEASGIIAIDLTDYQPEIEIVEFDIKDLLFMEMIVKEKEFREKLAAIDFSQYKEKAIAIICSTDAILPQWIFMSLADVFLGKCAYSDIKSALEIEFDLWKKSFSKADLSFYQNKKVVIRAKPELTPAMYFWATQSLKPIVKTLMYGEIGMPKVIYKR